MAPKTTTIRELFLCVYWTESVQDEDVHHRLVETTNYAFAVFFRDAWNLTHIGEGVARIELWERGQHIDSVYLADIPAPELETFTQWMQ